VRLFAIRLSSSSVEDAFVYRTSLYCWTFEGRLRVYAIADIERAIHETNDAGPLLTYALFHSRGIGARDAQVAAWQNSSSPRFQDPGRVDLDAEAIPYVEYRIGLEADSLLDLLIFYDRMYFATDGGLFSLDPFDPASAPPLLRTDTRFTDPCYAAEGGLGAVAASCGPKGLRLLLGEVGGSAGLVKPRRAAPVSVRAEVGYGTVVNHRTRSDFEFLAGELSGGDDGHVLTKVHRADVDRSAKVQAAVGPDDQAVEFTLWDRSRLVMFQGGKVLSVSVVVDETNRRLNSVRELGNYGVDARVISASRVGRTFAVETEQGVAVVGGDAARFIETGPIVSLRSYPRSHRYQRLVSATAKGGLWLLAVDL
jgi:hypothetical protein